MLSREVLGRARLERHRRKVRGATDIPEPDGSEKEMDTAEAAGEPVSKRKRASALAQEPQAPTSGDFQVGGSSASSGTAQGLATPEPPRNGTWAQNKSLWVERKADTDLDDSAREILAPAGSTDPRIQIGTN